MISDFWTDEVTVQPYVGAGSEGPSWSAAVQFLGYVVEGRKLVLNARAEEVTAEITIWCPPSLPSVADVSTAFKPGSLVTVRDDLPHRVITCKAFTRFGVIEYVELTTT